MQLTVNFNHTFDGANAFSDCAAFAAKFQAVFADLFKATNEKTNALDPYFKAAAFAPEYKPMPKSAEHNTVAVPLAVPVATLPVAGLFGGGNGGVSAEVVTSAPSRAISANPEPETTAALTENNTALEAAPAKRRGRRSRAEIEAQTKQTFTEPVVANGFFDVPSAPQKVSGSPLGSTQATADDVKAAISDLIMSEGGEVKLADFMRKNGWRKSTDVPETERNRAVTELKALLRA